MTELENYYKKNKFYTICKLFQTLDNSIQKLIGKKQTVHYFKKNTPGKSMPTVYEEQKHLGQKPVMN